MKDTTTATANPDSPAPETQGAGTPAQLIDARIRELGDWRGETLARVRALIKQTVPEVVEAWKWRGCRCGSTAA
jgi:hypothetical protein